MKLYYTPNTRASRPRWLLEELGIDYEIIHVDLRAGEHKTAPYKKIHPLGKVPALIDGEVVLFESAAICQYLADKYQSRGLAPRLDEPARGQYLQWITFATITLERPVAETWMQTRNDQQPGPSIEIAYKKFSQYADILTSHLEGRQYILGDDFSAADILIGSVLAWSGRLGMLDDYPLLLTYSARVNSRPAAVRARLTPGSPNL